LRIAVVEPIALFEFARALFRYLATVKSCFYKPITAESQETFQLEIEKKQEWMSRKVRFGFRRRLTRARTVFAKNQN